MFFRCVFLGLRQASRHWKHSAITLANVALSMAALALFCGYMDETDTMFRDTFSQRLMLGDALVVPTEAHTLMTTSTQAWVEATLKQQGALLFARFLPVSGVVESGEHRSLFFGLGQDVDAAKKMRTTSWEWNTLAGHPLQGESAEQLVSGELLAKSLGCVPLQRPKAMAKGGYPRNDNPIQCEHDQWSLSVLQEDGDQEYAWSPLTGITNGALRDLDMALLYLPISVAQKLRRTTGVGYYTVKFDASAVLLEWRDKFNRLAAAAHSSVRATLWDQAPEADLYLRSENFLNILRIFVLAILSFVVAITLLTTVQKTMSQRQRETNTLRTVGFRSSHLAISMITEALVLSTAACLLGVVVAWSVQTGINSVGMTYHAGILAEPIPLTIHARGQVNGLIALSLVGLQVTLTLFLGVRSARQPLRGR